MRKKYLLSLVIVLVISAGLILLLFLQKYNKKQNLSGKAADDQTEITLLKAELNTKPLSSFCAERGGRAITPFEDCSSGTRLSTNSQNPLYLCCK